MTTLGRPAECAADLLPAGPIGAERRRVHAPLPEHQPLEAQPLEFRDRRLRGDVRLARPVVEPPQVAPDRPLRPADPVMAAVLVEIRVEARDDVEPALEGEPEALRPSVASVAMWTRSGWNASIARRTAPNGGSGKNSSL